MKFGSTIDRDLVVKKLRALKLKQNGADIWVKPDLPLQIRVRQALLFGIKKMILDWGDYERGSIWADTDKNCIFIGNEAAIEIEEVNQPLSLKFGTDWAPEFECEEIFAYYCRQ